LLQLIDRPTGVTVEDAAAELECTVRTIWRDLSVLQKAGFPIYDTKAADGRRGLWKIREEFKLKLPLRLSLAELAALVMSRSLLTATGGVGILGPAVNSAFDRITSVLSRDALKLLDQMRETIGIRAFGAKLQLPAAEHLPTIQRALTDRRRLRIRYYSMNRDDETVREIDPYHLTYYNGGLYLVAYCHLRGAPRIFAVERIRQIETLPARFDVPKDFKVEEYLREALGIIRGDVVTVKVRFAPEVAPYIRERLWHPTQQCRDVDGGGVELTMKVADALEVRRWILGFGTQAEALEPAALREALRVEAEARRGPAHGASTSRRRMRPRRGAGGAGRERTSESSYGRTRAVNRGRCGPASPT
jgi:predicted DNA-binding transcriptional regulator YafY